MPYVPKKVMITTPHPDDCEIAVGGTVAKWVREGAEAVLVVCTNGDKGSGDPEMTSEKLAKIREKEQAEAAKVMGIKEVVFLRHPDGGLEDSYEFRGDLVREIRRHQPDVVMTPDPYRKFGYNHRDHRMTGQVTLDAVFPYARDHLSYPEHKELGLETHKVGQIYVWGSDEANTRIDITDTLELKIEALGKHKSQVTGVAGRDVGAFMRENAKRAAEEEDGMEYAEAFRVIEYRR